MRRSVHLFLLVFTLGIFFAQVPLGMGDIAGQTPLDSTAHVLLPAAATSLLYDLAYARVVHSPVQYFVTMVLLGVSAEMIWEVIEFAGDAFLRLSLQVDNADTMADIMCGIAGALLGAALRLTIWSRTQRQIRTALYADAAPPSFYHACSRRPGRRPYYRGLWVAGPAGGWCRDQHTSAADALRCARARWWQQHHRDATRRTAPWVPAAARWAGALVRRVGEPDPRELMRKSVAE